ncbi:MAG TPA: efflux RND transporter periplasmic adaptor subunit [Candidatus Acidoferrum sp.]|nr:efflux RND transporter periplasmic adaptor subunit [Candidatus Acidoferrum sp.]
MTTTTSATATAPRRRTLMLAIMGIVAASGIAYGTYWMKVARYVETTDNAYVGGNVVQITPQVAGTVVTIGADDTQFVSAGQTLVQLDKSDADILLQKAESQLAQSVRQVRNLTATGAQWQATIDMRKSDLNKASSDLARRERLATSGAIAQEDVQHAREAMVSAQAALTAAQQQYAATRALVSDVSLAQNPEVQLASVAVKDAYLNLARATLPAPVAGFVAKRNVQLGQRVSPGTPLMAVVPLDQVWVDANFKESQLAHVRIGQSATLTADLYGGRIVYHGRVAGFGVGTGAAFSLLPAQNATGNWIKIVQRVPVRIELDANELKTHPLQIGLSMQVEVDTHERGGLRLPEVARTAPTYQTSVFATLDDQAALRVKAIIAANEGRAATTTMADKAVVGMNEPMANQ